MSELLTRFAAIRHETPDRVLLHLPGAHAGECVGQGPDQSAVQGAAPGAAPGAELSADDIWQAHLRYAELLEAVGVGPGQLVVSAAGNSPASVGFLLACRAIGAAIMPADSGTTLSELMALVERFGAAVLLLPGTVAATDPRLDTQRATALDPGLGWGLGSGFGRGPDSGLRLFPTLDVRRRSYTGSALLKLTSGSTGTPKATMTSEAQLMADTTHIMAAMNITPRDVQIAAIPLSHSYGLGNLVLPLLLQGTPIVLREAFVPHQLPADARRFGARVFPGVPFMFQFFLSTPPSDPWPPTLQWLISAGAPLPLATIRAFRDRFGVKIHSFYGTSETGGIAFDADDEIDDGGTVGRPLPGVTVSLRDDDGLSGRIHVRSAAVANGYTDGGQDVFVDGGFLTGDCGAWDARERLTLTGRVSSFANVAGRKVHPDEVEQVLRTMPGIVDARVVAAIDSRRGEQLAACLVAEHDGATSALAVRRFCAARLAPFKIPRTIIFVDAIPLTIRGKTDRDALAALVRARLGS